MGLELCRRHPVTHDRMGTWHRAASAKEVVGSWATTEARRFRKTSRSVNSSTLPSCDGGSNATIRNSSRRSGWDILKDGDGAASTITLCIAAYGFLISERETIPPSTDRATRGFPQFAVREGYQPRGSAVAA